MKALSFEKMLIWGLGIKNVYLSAFHAKGTVGIRPWLQIKSNGRYFLTPLPPLITSTLIQ